MKFLGIDECRFRILVTQRRRDDNKKNICVFKGGGNLGAKKKIDDAVFLGNAMTI